MVTALPPRAARPADPVDACVDLLLSVTPAVQQCWRATAPSWSLPQRQCLDYIASHDGTALHALARHLGIAMPTASSLVERLERDGAVRSSQDPADRRRRTICITPVGRQRLKRLDALARRALASPLGRMAPQETAALRRGLTALQRSLQPKPAE